MQSKQFRTTPTALIIFGVLLAGLLVWAWAPAKAAPPGQTVPIPTATPPIEVPEATPTPDDGDNGGDDGDDEDVVDPGDGETLPDDETVAPPLDVGLPDLEEGAVVFSQVGEEEATFYAGPGTNFALLGTLPPGTPVELIGRNAGLAWYVACCLPDGQAGWVAAVQLVDAPLAEVTALPVLSDWRAPEAAAAPEPAPAADEAELTVLASYSPQIVVPGETVTLQFEVENLSTAAATDVQLRAEIVDALAFLTGQAVDGELMEPAAGADPAVVLVEWPSLEPGELSIVTFSVQMADDLLPGAVVSQLVAVDAANASAKSAQALVGLPPASVPSFR